MKRWARAATAGLLFLAPIAVLTGAQGAEVEALAPSEPTNVRATNGLRSIELAWDAPQHLAATVSEYRVYRGTTGGDLALHATTTETRFGQEVSPGSTYFFAVSAVGLRGQEGPRSAAVAAGSLLASAPSDLDAVVKEFGASGKPRFSLTWQSPSYVGGGPISEYRVYDYTRTLVATVPAEDTDVTVITESNFLAVTAVNPYGEGRFAFFEVSDCTEWC